MLESGFAPTFPPLLKGAPLALGRDPMTEAIRQAQTSSEVVPGLVHYAEDDDVFSVALVLAPEEPLRCATRVGFAGMLGLSDAIGALAPPETAVHFTWPDQISVNGASCGAMTLAASSSDPDTEPDWLVVALKLHVANRLGADPGTKKDETTLHDEGCQDISVPGLIESWSRHGMVWISRYVEAGFEPIKAAWTAACDTIGKDVDTPVSGKFEGLDEFGNMCIRTDSDVTVVPLTQIVRAS